MNIEPQDRLNDETSSSGNHLTSEIAEDTTQTLQSKKEYEFKLFIHYCQKVIGKGEISKKKKEHLGKIADEVCGYILADFKEENLDNIADILISGFGLDRPIEVDDAKLKEFDVFLDIRYYFRSKNELLFIKLISKLLNRNILVYFELPNGTSGIVLGIDKALQDKLIALTFSRIGCMRIEKMENISTSIYTEFWQKRYRKVLNITR